MRLRRQLEGAGGVVPPALDVGAMAMQLAGAGGPVSLGGHPALVGLPGLGGGNGHMAMPTMDGAALLMAGAQGDAGMFAMSMFGANRATAHFGDESKGSEGRGRGGDDAGKGRLDDWNAVHNPLSSSKLGIELVHTLEHDSVVCCVRFSNNGQYIATGYVCMYTCGCVCRTVHCDLVCMYVYMWVCMYVCIGDLLRAVERCSTVHCACDLSCVCARMCMCDMCECVSV